MVSLFWAADVLACTVCFKGDPSQTANVALRAGVLLLLGVVIAVLGSFAFYFIQVAKRSNS